AALRVRDQAREVERRRLGANGRPWCREGRDVTESPDPAERRPQRAGEEPGDRRAPVLAVLLEPAHDEQLLRPCERDVQQPRLVVLLALVARAVEERVRQVPLLGTTEPARRQPPLDQ